MSVRRNVTAFGATSFLNDTASEMAYWILPAFLATIGAGPAQLGIIEGIAESVAALAKFASGYFTDRVRRRKPIVVAGYAVANLAKPILAIATSWWHVLGVRFADRLAKGVRGAPRDVMLADSVDTKDVGSAFGLLQAMDSAGAIVGPLAAMLLVGHIGPRGVFWAAAVPGFVAIFVVVTLVKEPRHEDVNATAQANGGSELRNIVSHTKLPRRFFYMLVAVTLFSLGNSSDMFLVLRAQETGIALTFAPLLGLVFNMTYTAFSWPAGKLSDRIPRHLVAAAGYIVFALVYAAFAAAPSSTVIWISMAMYGGYYALTGPVLRAMVVDAAPREVRGRAFGYFYFATSVATLLASVVTGWLWKTYGAPLPLGTSAALALVAALMLLLRPSATSADAKAVRP